MAKETGNIGKRGASDSSLDSMFKDLEAEVTSQFTEEHTLALWGDALGEANPNETLKVADDPNAPWASFDLAGRTAMQSLPEEVAIDDTSLDAADVTVMLSMHADGSASMTMPGASVTLSPRKASMQRGSEYEIGDVLGRGGMGVVNIARQASLDRRIVVKSIRPEFATRVDAQEKFITEALATGSLDHPNVVPIHDMGVAEDGNLFYVMKEVKGRNWRDALPTLSEEENIDILFRVCDAVACAHDRGIIHRDLKPENVMLGDYGEVLVMDWGLAAAISPSAKAAHLTNVTACAGTPSFMSPEMARGLAHDIGPWSDQYLLGAILFNILAGNPPHPGQSAVEGVKNAANNIIRPAERNDEWMNIAMRAMHTVPHKRYPSVKAFQRALGSCRTHHESITLSNKGDEHIAAANRGEGLEAFSRAINCYEQALVLWSENPGASRKLREARYAYAKKSFDNGDFGLCLSLLAGQVGERERALLIQARKEQATRDARRRMVKILGFVAAALLALVAIVSVASYIIISRQAAAERQAKLDAESQRRIADQRRVEASEQRDIAQQQRNLAEQKRREAEELRLRAEKALQDLRKARIAEARAQELRLKETAAKLEAEERVRQRAEEALRAREEIQRLGYLEDNSRWRFDSITAKRRQADDAAKFELPVTSSISANGASIAMQLIPSGYFVMGSPPRDPSRNNDEYLHEVDLTLPYMLSATEITRAQWRAVVGVESLDDLGIDDDDEKIQYVLWRVRPLTPDSENLPATGVSYEDINGIFLPALAKLNPQGHYRLPTEAEWEWAARAGTTGHFYTGDSERALDAAGWYEGNSDGRLQPVGGKEPNHWGLFDMVGNAWELTLDAYDPLYYLRSPRSDPVNLDPGVPQKVTRGGSYINNPRLCRVSYRSTFMHQKNRYPHAGFRIAWARRVPWTDPDEKGLSGDALELDGEYPVPGE